MNFPLKTSILRRKNCAKTIKLHNFSKTLFQEELKKKRLLNWKFFFSENSFRSISEEKKKKPLPKRKRQKYFRFASKSKSKKTNIAINFCFFWQKTIVCWWWNERFTKKNCNTIITCIKIVGFLNRTRRNHVFL